MDVNQPEAQPTPTPTPQPEQPAQPVQPAQAAPAGQAAPAAEPTDVLGIVSIILAFFFPLAGLIVGFVGMNKAKQEGRKITLSKIGIIVNAAFMVLGLLAFVALMVLSSAASVQQ